MPEDSTEKPAVMDLASLGINFEDREGVSAIEAEQKSETPAAAQIQTSTTVCAQEKPPFSYRMKMFARFVVFLVAVGILYYGRFSVPEEEVACLKDKVLNLFEFANDYINSHEGARRAFQIICSLFVDIVFLITMAVWVIKGNSCRFPATLAVFYVVRAAIQKVFLMPFTEGYYWENPGFPSLVVPYGRGSDFFYSGHSGFLVICSRELHQMKFFKARNLAILTLLYTIMILIIFRIHYSIDIFTGVFFADWCFIRMNQLKDYIDPLIFKILVKLKSLIIKPKSHNLDGNQIEIPKAKEENKVDPNKSRQPEQHENIIRV